MIADTVTNLARRTRKSGKQRNVWSVCKILTKERDHAYYNFLGVGIIISSYVLCVLLCQITVLPYSFAPHHSRSLNPARGRHMYSVRDLGFCGNVPSTSHAHIVSLLWGVE